MSAKGHKFGGHAKAYIRVWAILLVLTLITVTVSYFNFGDWNVFVAMLVATVKGALVCLIFMHLKYDNRVNQVVFISAFLFLGIFILLTGSDEWFRPDEKPVRVLEAATSVSGADMEKLMKASPELVAKGKEIFNVQCAVCHGASGKGDGPGGVALNPKPRDFTSGYWKFGGAPSQVFHTITNGSPGTSMAGFGSVPVADRWALVAFVRSLSSNTPADTPETLKQSGVAAMLESKGDSGSAAAPAQTIPVSFAIQRYIETELAPADQTTPPEGSEQTGGLGQKNYQTHCMSCHGLNGKGGIPVSVVSFLNEKKKVYLKTKNLVQSQQPWVTSQAAFIDLVSKGLPGRNMPGFADFSAEEWNALYSYVQSFR